MNWLSRDTPEGPIGLEDSFGSGSSDGEMIHLAVWPGSHSLTKDITTFMALERYQPIVERMTSLGHSVTLGIHCSSNWGNHRWPSA